MKPDIPKDAYADIHRLMPIICVDCVVSFDNRILLIKRKQEPMEGTWWFPGGRLIRNERLEHAPSRIVKSEAGIDIMRPVPIGHDETKFKEDPFGHGGGTHTVNFVYAARIAEMSMMRVVLDDNHCDYLMFTYSEIYRSNMHPYIKRFTALAEGIFKK